MPPREGIYGLIAEFNTPSELVYATEQAYKAGYRRMSATPRTRSKRPPRLSTSTRPASRCSCCWAV